MRSFSAARAPWPCQDQWLMMGQTGVVVEWELEYSLVSHGVVLRDRVSSNPSILFVSSSHNHQLIPHTVFYFTN